MERDSKIYVAGHRGLVGSAIVRRLQAAGYANLVIRTHAELDLTHQSAVREFLTSERPEYVFLAAAKVGGILANDTYPAEFIEQNLAIQNSVIHESWRAGVRRLLFLGSSCIYPRDCPQPIKEEYLLTGPLESTNRAYAIAKIAGIEMCWSYNRQYGARFLAAMPTNLYGPGDNYDLQNSHVVPALIRKTHEARERGLPEVMVWGTGKPRREFLHSDDMAEACLFLMSLPDDVFARLLGIATSPIPDSRFAIHSSAVAPHSSPVTHDSSPPLINIGCGEDLTIEQLAELVAKTIGFKGTLKFDPSKPDGTPRKLLDVGRLFSLGWRPSVPLEAGIKAAYGDFLKHHSASA